VALFDGAIFDSAIFDTGEAVMTGPRVVFGIGYGGSYQNADGLSARYEPVTAVRFRRKVATRTSAVAPPPVVPPATSAAAGTITGAAGGITIDPLILSPSLALATGQATYPPSFDIASLGDAIVGDTLRLGRYDTAALTTGETFYTHVVTQPDVDQAAPRVISFSGLSAVTSGTYRWVVAIVRGAVRSSNSNTVTHGPNDIAPALSSFAATNVTDTTATVGVTTNYPLGTLYHLRNTTAAPPTVATIIASGVPLGITTAGVKTFAQSSLTATTAYYSHFVHTPDAGPNSSVLTGTFTTLTPVVTTGFDPLLQEEVYTYSNTDHTATKVQNSGVSAGTGLVGATVRSSGLWAYEVYCEAGFLPFEIQPGFKDTGSATVTRYGSGGEAAINNASDPAGGTLFAFSTTNKLLLIVNLSATAISGYPARTVSFKKDGVAGGRAQPIPAGLVNVRPWVGISTPIGSKVTINTGQVPPMGGVPTGATMWG